MKKVIVGIGSNLGDRLANIQQGVCALKTVLKDLTVSSIVESQAELLPDAPSEWNLPFLNCAVLGKTHLEPRTLLNALKQIEGGSKTQKWAPRKLDLDILAIDGDVVQEEDLIIPHPRLLRRPFALHPMSQLVPFWEYPVRESPAWKKPLIELLHPPPEFTRYLVHKPYFIGIVNITPDSFSDGSLDVDLAINRALELWEDGASYIELGSASSNPRSILIKAQDEWRRLQPVLESLKKLKNPPRLCVDTYNTETALCSLQHYDVDMINFVHPEIDARLVAEIATRKKKLVIMHALSLPPQKTAILPFRDDPLTHIEKWATISLQKLTAQGLEKNQIIIDPGIGFGKSAIQNILILQGVNKLHSLEVEILVGHSRKSFMQYFLQKKPAERDLESALLSTLLMQEGVDYLRVHDVKIHMQQLVTHRSMMLGKEDGA